MRLYFPVDLTDNLIMIEKLVLGEIWTGDLPIFNPDALTSAPSWQAKAKMSSLDSLEWVTTLIQFFFYFYNVMLFENKTLIDWYIARMNFKALASLFSHRCSSFTYNIISYRPHPPLPPYSQAYLRALFWVHFFLFFLSRRLQTS